MISDRTLSIFGCVLVCALVSLMTFFITRFSYEKGSCEKKDGVYVNYKCMKKEYFIE